MASTNFLIMGLALLSFVFQNLLFVGAISQVADDASVHRFFGNVFLSQNSQEDRVHMRSRRDKSVDCEQLHFKDSMTPFADVYYLQTSKKSGEVHRKLQPLWMRDVLIVVTEPDTYNSKEGSHLYRIERNLNWDFSDKSGYLQNHQVSSLSLTMSRADESVAFILSSNIQLLFVTRDTGNTWTLVRLPDKAYEIFYDPTSAANMFIHVWSSGKVYLSTDYGQTWKPKISDVIDIYCFTCVDNNADVKGANYVYYLQEDGTMDPHSHILVRANYILEDNKKIQEHVFAYVEMGRFLFLSKQNKSDTTNHTRRVYTSTDHGRSFHQAHIPGVTFSQSYIVLKTHEAGAFIHFIDKQKDLKKGTLYVSDSSVTHFTISLENHFFAYQYHYPHDFYEVMSMKGVYLTSVYITETKKISSRITFDNGGEWNTLQCTSPESKDLNIHTEFSVNSHAIKSMYIQGPLSHSTAPGLVLANGMFEDIPAGEVYTVNVTLTVTKTYFVMSEDGGETWQRPKNISSSGFYLYGIFDYGNAIAVLQTNTNIPTIWYSHNRGKCFFIFKETSGNFLPKTFLPVPKATDKKGAIFGQTTKDNAFWAFLIIEMSDFLGRPCTTNDYMLWQPTATQCILGGNYTFNITKYDSMCFSTVDYSPAPVNTVSCPCSLYLDFECSYGYIRNATTKNCSKMNLSEKYRLSNLCPIGSEKFNYSIFGYARVPGDICTGGSDSLLEIKEAKCAGHETDSGEGYTNSVEKVFTEDSTGKIVGAIIVVVVAILCLVAGIYIIYRCRKGKKSDDRVNYRQAAQDSSDVGPLMPSNKSEDDSSEEEDDEMLNPDPTTLKV